MRRILSSVNLAGVAFAGIHAVAAIGFTVLILAGIDHGVFSFLLVALSLPVSMLYLFPSIVAEELFGKIAGDCVFYGECIVVGSIWWGCIGDYLGVVISDAAKKT